MNDKPRPGRIADTLFQELLEREGQAFDRIVPFQARGYQDVVEAFRHYRADRGGQVADALEVVVEGALRDSCGIHHRINRQGLGGAFGQQHCTGGKNHGARLGATFPPDLCPARQIHFCHALSVLSGFIFDYIVDMTYAFKLKKPSCATIRLALRQQKPRHRKIIVPHPLNRSAIPSGLQCATDRMTLNIVIGSTRPGRAGPVIARWLYAAAVRHDALRVNLVDLADFALPLLDEAEHPAKRLYANEPTKRWSASVAAADAFLFVTPEYDYFPPASLVNAIQVLLHEWGYKPAGIMSYGGASGGLRASQVLRQLLGNVNVHALPQTVAVPVFARLVHDGTFNPDPTTETAVTVLIDELRIWAKALRNLREERDAAIQARTGTS